MIIYFVVLMLILIPIALYDIKHQIIENWAVAILFAIGLLNLVFKWFPITFAEALLGCVVSGIFFLILSYFGMGGGDIKLISALGFMLGIKLIIAVIWLAFVSGCIFSIIMLIARKLSFKSYIPFAPFITLGVMVVLLFKNLIIVRINTLLELIRI